MYDSVVNSYGLFKDNQMDFKLSAIFPSGFFMYRPYLGLF